MRALSATPICARKQQLLTATNRFKDHADLNVLTLKRLNARTMRFLALTEINVWRVEHRFDGQAQGRARDKAGRLVIRIFLVAILRKPQ